MKGYLAVLMLTPGQLATQMNRRLFPDEQSCRDWIKTQKLPSYAIGWYMEVYNDEGVFIYSQGIAQ